MKNFNYHPYQAYKPYNISQSYQQITPITAQTIHTNHYPQSAQTTGAERPINCSATMSSSALMSAGNYQYPNQYNFNATNNYYNHVPLLSNHYYSQQQQQHPQQQQQQIQPKQQLSQLQQYEANRTENNQSHHQTEAATSPTTIGADKFTMDAREIANFLANELFMHQLVSVDGIQSGVPTLTTSTLTPTTLRSIEETFYELTQEPINAPPYQAGFIPPPLASFPTSSNAGGAVAGTFNGSIQDFNDVNDDDGSEDSHVSDWNDTPLNENSMATTDTSSGATDSTSFQNGFNGMGNNSLATSNNSSTNDFTAVNIAIVAAAAANAAKNGGINNHNNNNTSNCATKGTTRRNQGGRRPNKSTNITPEEEEKRRIRRERNKLAAARCRKRRVDQTNELLEEVAVLEKKREVLQKDIESLNTTKQELEYILEAHRPTCQKVRHDLLTVNTINGLIVPTTTSNNNTGMETTLASIAGRSDSPLDLKPELNTSIFDVHIKNEPELDSNSSVEEFQYENSDGPPAAKRIMRTKRNPMVPPPLPNVATLTSHLASLAAAANSASLNTPIVTTAPISFGSVLSTNATLNTLNALNKPPPNGSRQRPNSLPTIRRTSAQHPQTDINGVAIQTPSTGMFNFDSLMDGGTGLTPVSGPLMPTCSSLQSKHPLELTTPTSEPSKLVSL